ncbi:MULTISPECIES: DNA polymerase/3'-5' exonuclease PolX [unclassified Streptomyces]|uniref:DNA polymerase/3'-5' exonuclease PolX n=1 Tax=unclassified Streptomyces TaxID=2593676 RepID=UPI002E12947A|nr:MULTISPECIES: DNA polymerase/3'-5' exonuclease PolX [unclassified Streptomyces]WSR24347.1 DNA polymerase/3'-5' exonuclease PolX [Streptomyces sp. NBC_01205]
MARANERVEALLQEYADLIAISGGDAFKARAYEKAARAVGGHPADVAGLDAKALREIPHVGRSIADKIVEYLGTGRVPDIEASRAAVPAGVRELTAIPGLGPRKALVLYEKLGISSVEQLQEAVRQERLRDLKGFGEQTEQNILHGISVLRNADGRILLGAATDVAEQIVAEMERIPGCVRCAYAGSLRRMRETIGDIDVLVAADRSAPFMTALAELPHAAEVIVHGAKKTSIRTGAGLQIDLRVLPPASWGAGLQYFTGSKAHNVRLRALAVRQGLKLSEYGLFDVESGENLASETEEEVYARLGLPWIAPPLREDRGEVAAALRGELPGLVAEGDIRGDLHTHTDLTDGLASLEEMVAAAAARGHAYYAVTDHAPDLAMQRMTQEKVLAQRERVRALDRTVHGMRLLHGTELNIGPDGGLDWPDAFLADFDLCVASVHSHFGQSRQDMTRRFIRACENPNVAVIGHPTTRRIGRRPGVDADFDAVFEACARTGTALEINAHPERLDLCDEDVLRAKRHGVKFAVNSDAHATTHLPYLRYGVGTAQRGWLTKDDVVNAWPWARLHRFLREKRTGRV